MSYPQGHFNYPYSPYNLSYHQRWNTPCPTHYPTPWENPYEEESIEALKEMVEQLLNSPQMFQKSNPWPKGPESEAKCIHFLDHQFYHKY